MARTLAAWAVLGLACTPSGEKYADRADVHVAKRADCKPTDTCKECGCPDGTVACLTDLGNPGGGTCYFSHSRFMDAHVRKMVREELADAGVR